MIKLSEKKRQQAVQYTEDIFVLKDSSVNIVSASAYSLLDNKTILFNNQTNRLSILLDNIWREIAFIDEVSELDGGTSNQNSISNYLDGGSSETQMFVNKYDNGNSANSFKEPIRLIQIGGRYYTLYEENY